MNEQEQIHKTIGEMEGAMNMSLLANAMRGCAARHLWVIGYEQKANEAIEGGEPVVKVLMDLAHDLETRIRSGAGLDKALDDMRAAGWLARIDNLETGE
jgi:hypothetical protein